MRRERAGPEPPLHLAGTTAVVLDVAGTIAGTDPLVSPRTRAVMRDLEEQGVPVVVATGRTRDSVLDVLRQAGLRTPGVSCNGALVTDPVSDRDLRTQTMDPADVTAMVRVHEETGAARFVAGHFAEERAAVVLEEVLRQVAP